jgi:tetratricopeptide (TPR) repeat protein
MVVVSIGHALRLCTLPVDQGLYYGHLRDSVFGKPIDEASWIVMASVASWLIVGVMGRRMAGFGLGWFALALLPVSNVVPTGVLVAERTLYLPSMGACFLAAALLDRVGRRSSESGRLVSASLAGLVVASVIASNLVVGRWTDETTLWRTTVESHPRSPMAHEALGWALLDRRPSASDPMPNDLLREAGDEFRKARELNPKLAGAARGAGVVAWKLGDLEEAERLLRQAVALEPNDQAARMSLRDFLEARKKGPDSFSWPGSTGVGPRFGEKGG